MKIRLPRLNINSLISLFLIVILISACKSEPEFSEEWSNYRGTNRDGISNTQIPIKVWDKQNPIKPVWKHKIGDGFSGIVLDGKNFITAFAEDSSEIIAGYDRKTGNEIWRTNIGKVFVEEFGNGPRATPILDGNLAFINNSWGHIYAVDTKTGKLKWKYELSDTLEIKQPQFGHCTSPVVVGDYLIIHAGGREENTGFYALDKKTGTVKWKTGQSVVSYSSPIFVTINNVPQIIFASTKIVEVDGKRRGKRESVSLSPEGKPLWTGPSVGGVIAMPLFIPPNKIFISSSNDKSGCILVEVNKEGNEFKADTAWFSMQMQNHFNSSVYHKDYIYGFSNATLHCVDAKTGKRKWRKRGLGKGSLIIADNKLIILTDRGNLVLADTNSEEYVELAKTKVIEGLTWTSPTLADGKLYLRSREEIACYDLSK